MKRKNTLYKKTIITSYNILIFTLLDITNNNIVLIPYLQNKYHFYTLRINQKNMILQPNKLIKNKVML